MPPLHPLPQTVFHFESHRQAHNVSGRTDPNAEMRSGQQQTSTCFMVQNSFGVQVRPPRKKKKERPQGCIRTRPTTTLPLAQHQGKTTHPLLRAAGIAPSGVETGGGVFLLGADDAKPVLYLVSDLVRPDASRDQSCTPPAPAPSAFIPPGRSCRMPWAASGAMAGCGGGEAAGGGGGDPPCGGGDGVDAAAAGAAAGGAGEGLAAAGGGDAAVGEERRWARRRRTGLFVNRKFDRDQSSLLTSLRAFKGKLVCDHSRR